MKRNGILTFHDGINYGAFLQAYALQRYLAGVAVPNVIINYKSARFTWKEYACFLARRNPAAIAANLLKIATFRRCQRRFVRTRRVLSAETLGRIPFETVVIGSDAVWHFTSPLCGYDATYFGANLRAERLVAYAVSCGPDSATADCPADLPDLVKRFDHISVRDENTRQFVRDTAQREATLVVDPTFLYDFAQEAVPPPEKDYVAVYAQGLSDDEVSAVRALAHKTGKTLISIGYRNVWCDVNRFVLSPFRWLGYIKHADLVVTSMYHGTLLAAKMERSFCTIVTPYRANKLTDFLQRASLSDRMVGEPADIQRVCATPPDWRACRERLRPVIERSREFLGQALREDTKA